MATFRSRCRQAALALCPLKISRVHSGQRSLRQRLRAVLRQAALALWPLKISRAHTGQRSLQHGYGR